MSCKIKENMTIIHGWVYNQACKLSHSMHVIYHIFNNVSLSFKLISKSRIPKDSFEIDINNKTKSTQKLALICPGAE